MQLLANNIFIVRQNKVTGRDFLPRAGLALYDIPGGEDHFEIGDKGLSDS